MCELVSLFILHHLRAKFKNKNIGLYGDDGRQLFKTWVPEPLRKLKTIYRLFARLDLKITCEANLKIVKYLDVTFNLPTKKYNPYRKEDNPSIFINTSSNHPPSIFKHLPNAIGNQISSLSLDESEFEKSGPIYKSADSSQRSNTPNQVWRSNKNVKKRKDPEKFYGLTLRTAAMLKPTMVNVSYTYRLYIRSSIEKIEKLVMEVQKT